MELSFPCGLRGPVAADLHRAHFVPPTESSPPRHPFAQSKSARNARIRRVRLVTWSGISESLLISDRNACFKQCLISALPCFLHQFPLFQRLKCLLSCWIRAHARIWAQQVLCDCGFRYGNLTATSVCSGP